MDVLDTVIKSAIGLTNSLANSHTDENGNINFDIKSPEGAFYIGQILGVSKVLKDVLDNYEHKENATYMQNEENIRTLFTYMKAFKKD